MVDVREYDFAELPKVTVRRINVHGRFEPDANRANGRPLPLAVASPLGRDRRGRSVPSLLLYGML